MCILFECHRDLEAGKDSEIHFELVLVAMSVVPATQKAEAGGSLEPRSLEPIWAT
jgi:hypothetical protein